MYRKTSKKIVIATLGSLGDLHPCMAIGLELQRRGHQVVIATAGFYRRKVEQAGLDFHSIRPDQSPEDPDLLRRIMHPSKGPKFMVRNLLMPKLRETYEDLLTICRDANFLISGEVVYPAPIVAEQLGVPWASAILSPSSFFSAYDPPVIPAFPVLAQLRGSRSFSIALAKLARLATRSWGNPVDALRADLGLSQSRHALFADKFSPHLNLAMFSAVLASRQPDWPKPTQVTGFVFYDRGEQGDGLAPEVRRFLEDGEPPIVFTLGSAVALRPGEFFEEGWRAAKLLGRRALLVAGKVRPDLPSSRELMVTDYAPYSEIFSRAAVVVHQGGIGTTAQAIRAGRPQLVHPHMFDQPDNAARVERLGIARVVARGRFRAKTVSRVLRDLLENDSSSREAKRYAGLVRAEDGVHATCNAVESAMQIPSRLSFRPSDPISAGV
jgi:UDP:flavonoid glycosyltransferase YjiC (YdhE family)